MCGQEIHLALSILFVPSTVRVVDRTYRMKHEPTQVIQKYLIHVLHHRPDGSTHLQTVGDFSVAFGAVSQRARGAGPRIRTCF